MASYFLKKKIKFTAFAERRNQHTQVLCILCLQDLRILAIHLKGPEKDDLLQTSLMQECFKPQELGLAARVTNTLDNEGKPQGFAKASKSEAWMDSMQEELSSLINNQNWTLVNLPPGRKAIRCGWIYKA
jgi:hypothetical protein